MIRIFQELNLACLFRHIYFYEKRVSRLTLANDLDIIPELNPHANAIPESFTSYYCRFPKWRNRPPSIVRVIYIRRALSQLRIAIDPHLF
jgi:hypothetical protein